MNDITKHWRFQRILREAAQWRTLRRILAGDPTDILDAMVLPEAYGWADGLTGEAADTLH